MSRKAVAAKFVNDVYDISITGRNVLVTDTMKDYAIEKISKIDRFHNRVIDVHVTMDIQKLEHRVDIMMSADQIKIKSSASSENMYASIDKAVDRLQTQLRRYKDRIRNHHIKRVDTVDMNVNILERIPDELAEVNDDIDSLNSDSTMVAPKIVARETRFLKTLDQGEAVMKMALSGDVFMVYRSEEDQKLKVIYRRKDGNFGIIEPEK